MLFLSAVDLEHMRTVRKDKHIKFAQDNGMSRCVGKYPHSQVSTLFPIFKTSLGMRQVGKVRSSTMLLIIVALRSQASLPAGNEDLGTRPPLSVTRDIAVDVYCIFHTWLQLHFNIPVILYLRELGTSSTPVF